MTGQPPATHISRPAPGVRLTAYRGGAAIRSIGHDLSHLDRLAVTSHGRGQSSWLEDIVGDHDTVAVTLSVDGRLAGYAVGTPRHGVTDLTRLVAAPSLLTTHAHLLGHLVDAFIDLPDTPWADVRVDPSSLALSHLLATGWRPTTTPTPTQARPRLTLRAA